MPSVKELYKKLSDVKIDADSISLNTDTVESLLSTVQADISAIKDTGILNNGTVTVSVGGGSVSVSGSVGIDGGSVGVNGGSIDALRDGDGNIFGLDRNFPVDVQGTVPVSGTFWPASQPVSGTVTAIQATASSLRGQAQILNSAGTLITYSESGTYGSPSVDVISVQNPQGTSATATTFTSTTASSVLVSASTSRKVLTVFNAGAGILYISPTSTATTTSFQVRLASGDYWECPERQVTMAHRAVFDTAGTAYITSIS